MSGSRDKTVKLWNTLGECKYTIGEPDGHTEWVSCVRFSPVTTNPIIVSAGWDKLVKVCWLGIVGSHARRQVYVTSIITCLFPAYNSSLGTLLQVPADFAEPLC